MLENLGLKPQVEQLYRLILRRPEWNLRQIAEELGWQESDVRDSLDTLADLRLVHAAVELDVFRPVNPEVGLAALLTRSEAELAQRQRQVEMTRAAVSALAQEYASTGTVSEVIERLDSVEAVRIRLSELAEAARFECLSFIPGGAQRPDTMSASKPLDQLALERGVALRTIYQESFRNDPSTVEYVRWLSALGGQNRTVPALPMLMVIVDRTSALVPLDPHDGRRGALELRSPGAVAAMVVLFEQFWSAGTRWDEPVRANDAGLTSREQELLRQLADGGTDELASRRLGVSLRTVRRMAADIMAKLDAKSRFEAGVRAAHRGWV